MIASLILLFLYALFLVWVAYHVRKNYDAISIFSFKRWVFGQSHSAVWFKRTILASAIFAGFVYAEYLASIT